MNITGKAITGSEPPSHTEPPADVTSVHLETGMECLHSAYMQPLMDCSKA